MRFQANYLDPVNEIGDFVAMNHLLMLLLFAAMSDNLLTR